MHSPFDLYRVKQGEMFPCRIDISFHLNGMNSHTYSPQRLRFPMFSVDHKSKLIELFYNKSENFKIYLTHPSISTQERSYV